MSSPLVRFATPLVVFATFYVAFFSPVLFGPGMLAYGDGIVQYVPEFYQPTALWYPDLFCGYPLAATPQAMCWYPLAGILNEFESGWDIFVLLGYVIASSTMCYYVESLTKSLAAGLLAGFVFGLSGFMVLHLTHPTMVHTAAWVPAILLALDRLRETATWKWFVGCALFTALSGVALHPQIFFYAMVVVAGYAVLRCGGAGVRTLAVALGALLMGAAAAAVQLVPSAEFAVYSERIQIDYSTFVSGALPPLMTPILFFPFAFGATPASFYAEAIGTYRGPSNLTELSGYIGFVPLLLSAFAVICLRRCGLVWFWVAVAVYAFVLALGDSPVARVAFETPGYNLFRAPGRHFMEFAIAVAALAGLGFSCLKDRSGGGSNKGLRWIATAGGIVLVGSASYLMVKPWRLVTLAPGLWDAPIEPWKNPALAVPLLLGLCGSAVLFYGARGRFARALVAFVAIAELVAFAWFLPWRLQAPSRDLLRPPERFAFLAEELKSHNQRLLPLIGTRGLSRGWEDWITPNLTMLWDIPCATGYKTLMPKRLAQLLELRGGGNVEMDWQDDKSRAFDIAAARYILAPHHVLQSKTISDREFERLGIQWAAEGLGVSLGGPQNSLRSVRIGAPDVPAESVHLVTALQNAVYLPAGTRVATMIVEGGDGERYQQALVCGSDTAEQTLWAPMHHGRAQHEPAEVFRSSAAVDRNGAPYERHLYVTALDLPEECEVVGLTIQLASKAVIGATSLTVSHVTLKSAQTHVPLRSVQSEWMSTGRWRVVDRGRHAVLLENLRAMPRAWLVPETVYVSESTAQTAIQTSTLPNEEVFDPARMALVESPVRLPTRRADWHGEATLSVLEPERLEVSTRSNGPSFLVVADNDFPGWTCTVDGQVADLVRTNYFARGVAVPEGSHRVEFVFRPTSFFVGAAISAVALLTLCAVAVIALLRELRRSSLAV